MLTSVNLHIMHAREAANCKAAAFRHQTFSTLTIQGKGGDFTFYLPFNAFAQAEDIAALFNAIFDQTTQEHGE